jgi:hypothetical protein
MGARLIEGMLSVVLCLPSLGCEESKKESPKAQVSAAAPSATTPPPAAEPPPEGCKASGDKPLQLGSVVGDVYGLIGDATHLYCATWQVYGGRGDINKIRKDGQGSQALAGLKLEPRGLALDNEKLYFTAGIRLNSVPKVGGTAAILDEKFSSQSIAANDKDVYGVPGNYGPYDRLVRIGKQGGQSTELASAKRPKTSTGPNGYNGMAIDDSAVYVADSGNGRIVKFALAAGKPQPLATGLKRPFDLSIDATNVYFSLAGGELMTVSKTGGKTTKLATGLVENARVAADSGTVYTALTSRDEGATITKASLSDGAVKPIALVPASHLVAAVAVDKQCVYWAERFDATKSVVFALAR